nr:hypothetical protein [Rhodoferax sp.]
MLFLYLYVASQLPVFKFQLPDALMLHGQRLAGTALPLLFRFKLGDPAPDGTFAKFHVFTDLTDAQALGFDHLSYLELEAGIEGSSGFRVIHVCRHLGLKKPIVVSF